MEVTTGNSLSEFSKCWLLLQKVHEKEINAVTEEVERWKRLYETECDLVSSLQKQLNVEVERLQKLLNIAETKITEKEAKIIEKDERLCHLESLIKAKTAEKDEIVTNLESLIKKADTGSQSDTKNDFTITDNTGSQPNNKYKTDNNHNTGSQPGDINNSPSVHHVDEESVNTSPPSPSLLEDTDPLSTPSRNHSNNINQKWMKRKRRKRLKQTTLTQHQNTDHKRQKLDRSIKVVPQTPCINLSSGSSCEDEYPVPSNDNSDEYTANNVNSQNCAANQDYTFVPDSSQKQNTNQDNTFVDNVASQVTSQNRDQTDHDFIPLVNSRTGVSVYPESNGSTNSTNQNQSTANQHLKDQRELKRSTPDPKYVETCRKKSDRNKLDAAPCHECAQWYADDDPKAVKQTCRHRFKHPPPNTPPAFWDIGFPDTAES